MPIFGEQLQFAVFQEVMIGIHQAPDEGMLLVALAGDLCAQEVVSKDQAGIVITIPEQSFHRVAARISRKAAFGGIEADIDHFEVGHGSPFHVL